MAVVATLALGASLACGGEGGREFRSIGTGGTGGVYYPLGGALANELSLADSTRQYTAEVTGGSVENVNRILQGQVDLGFALSVTAYRTYHEAQTGEPGRRLRVVAPMYPNLIHVLVREGSGIRSMADLRGARVAVGSAGSGTEQTSREILESLGLDYDQVDEEYLSFAESAAALADGALDAAILSVGYPAAAVLEATTGGSARILALSVEEMESIVDAHPYYEMAQIPPGVYPGVAEAIPTLAMMNWIVARDDLPEAIGEALLNVLEERSVSLERVHPMAAQIDLTALARAPAPLHPSAEARR
ncbi:MAG: TAXI family TRAP transporter solute-binding subunit [Gemmatimonadota bacterium]